VGGKIGAIMRPDRYSRDPVTLQQWLDNAVGNPPRSTPPADVTLQNVIDLGYRYHQLRMAAIAAQEARMEQYDTYRADMTEAEFSAWLKGRNEADEALYAIDDQSVTAYKELQYLMIQHAQDGTPRSYSGHVYGQRVVVTFEPVHGHVTVDVREEA
jgi:hypothetical protein